MVNKQQTGRLTEKIAGDYLQKDFGYKLLAYNERVPAGELDIIMLDGSTYVFVEVRSRKQSSVVEGSELLTRTKIKKLGRSIEYWLAKNGFQNKEWRLDFVAISLDDEDNLVMIEHVKGVGD